MKNSLITADKLAISFSALCLVHCLVLPLLIVMLPTIGTLALQQEIFHQWMVIAVIPTSLYALTLGCKKHKQLSLIKFGIVGLIMLISALFIGELSFGELGEKLLTLFGASIIAIAHIKNYRLCQQADDCCPKSS